MSRPAIPFWSRVDRRGPDDCWPWKGGGARGYGQTRRGGKSAYVHRLALEEALGRPIRPGLMALHHCDNPPCCNPSHLYEGTAADNSRDMYARDRRPLGSVHPEMTRWHMGKLRARGGEATSVASDEIESWMRDEALGAEADLERYADRIAHGGALPGLVA